MIIRIINLQMIYLINQQVGLSTHYNVLQNFSLTKKKHCCTDQNN